MQIDGDTLVMCRLVAFAEQEKQHARGASLNVEDYGQEVLRRFRVLYPDAILILGDLVIGSGYWRESLNKNHVRCCINGTWEFYSTHPMSVEVRTDGSIHLGEGDAEVIFNYVND